MKFEDLVTFAKAGYKPAEVKELLELQIDSEKVTKDPENEEKEPEKDTKDSENEEKEQEKDEKEPEPDYKKLYEESQAKLKEAQKANVSKDVSNSDDKKSDDDIVKDLFRSFM